MAKAKKTRKKSGRSETAPTTVRKQDLLDQLDSPRSGYLFLALVFIALLLIYKPIVFDGLDVKGSDVVSGIGLTHQVKAWEAQTGDRALWNPYMFAGMPLYHRHQGMSWSVDTLIIALDKLIDWRIIFLWLGALGMFWLARYLRFHNLVGMTASLAFILLPHSHALIAVGHFSKLRAIVYMPFILLAFLNLLEKRNLLGMLFFTGVFALQLRTQHYQIVFYTMLLLVFVGAWPYLKLLIEKKTGDFLKLNGLVISAVVLVGLIVAQPLLVIRDYTPFSTRGGQAVKLNEEVSQQDKKGVGFDYATNWSYSLPEFWNLVIPRFHGGTSDEGIPVPQLNNQKIPAYWGDLPFTQSYEYLGIIIAFLALSGILFRWRHPLVKSLTFLSLLSLMLALGKHFAPLYKLLFYYLPYFDKFRVPMMILTLVSFNAIVLAMFGLDQLMKGLKKEQLKPFYILFGVFAVIIASPLVFGGSLSLSSANEFSQYASRYGEQQTRQLIDLFKEARLDVLRTSVMRTLMLFGLGAGMLLMLLRQPARKGLWGLGIVLLVALDLGTISVGYLDGKFVNLKRIEQQTYRPTAVDPIIRQDASLYRVLPPLRIVGNDSRWPYFYQSIGGYNAAKPQAIQDIITNNLITPGNPQMPLNLAVIGMLNGKYIVENQQLSHPDLTFLGSDTDARLFLYRNARALPRAFLVDRVTIIADGAERLRAMNAPDFDPSRVAILDAPLGEDFFPPDSGSIAEVTDFSPNRIVIRTRTTRPALMVVSEVYYPRGWQATLENGKTLDIVKANHILRALRVPGGEHTITMSFIPKAYYTGITVSWIGWIVVYLGLLITGYRSYWHRPTQPDTGA